jgi:uncharacterized membrane protein
VILITIMVLELRTPHGTTWAALREDLPVLLAYVLSFVNIGIYWNNQMPVAVARRSPHKGEAGSPASLQP